MQQVVMYQLIHHMVLGGGGGGGYYGGGGGDGGVNSTTLRNAFWCRWFIIFKSNLLFKCNSRYAGSGTTALETGNTYYGSGAGAIGSGKNGEVQVVQQEVRKSSNSLLMRTK